MSVRCCLYCRVLIAECVRMCVTGVAGRDVTLGTRHVRRRAGDPRACQRDLETGYRAL